MTKRILCLDVSSSTGWAIVEEVDAGLKLIEYGLIENEKTVAGYGSYPHNYVEAARAMVGKIVHGLYRAKGPFDAIVVEETNLGKNRYSQKFLEFTHAFLILATDPLVGPVYLSSSAWRSTLGLSMTKQDKKNNALLSKAKKAAAASGTKLDKKTLGIKGKVSKKHVALRYVNETFGLTLKVKDNDIADAICLGAAYFKHAPVCDGT